MNLANLKVIYVTTDSFSDHSYTIAKYLKTKIDIIVFILGRNESAEIKEFCSKLNAKFLTRPRYRNPFAFFFEFVFLYKLRKLKPDVVWFDSLSLIRSLFAGFFIKKFFVSIHDFELHPNESDYQGIMSQRLTFLLHKRKIVTVSHTQAEIFRKRFQFMPLVFQLPVIDYYIDFAGNTENPPDTEMNIIRFFFFSTIEKYKGIEILLDAAEILERKNVPFRLNIYGKLKYDEDLILAKTNSIKNVKIYNEFINYKKVHYIYRNNDMQVLPYKQVTQCGPLLIGYSEGIPSICNDLPGFREYVVEGRSGEFFNGTASNLAEKMEFFINNKEKITEMSEFIKSEIYNKFSMKSLVNKYIENFK